MLCKYKDIFGEPRKGSHSYRVLDIAVVDVIATMIIAYFILLYKPDWEYWKIVAWLFVLSIVLHRLFCVRTTIDKILF